MKTQAILVAALALLLGAEAGLIKPPPGTASELIKPEPSNDIELVKPAPESDIELIKPAPGSGGSLSKPAPGTGGSLIKPAPGSDGSLIKPAPGNDGDLSNPAPGSDAELTRPLPPTNSNLTKPAPERRKVLPHLVLSPELANALQNAQIFISSTILKESTKNRLIPTENDLALDDIYFTIDDDTSVQLSNLKLVNVPYIDVASVKTNLEFLNLGLDIDLGTLQVGGNFEIINKNVFSEIPVASSGDLILRNSDVKAIGKVGLSIVGDYFKTVNYDILYEGTGTYLTVSYENDQKRVVSGLDVGDQEAKVVQQINSHLQKVLNNLLKSQLEDILDGISVDELIGESRAAQSYRAHARALRFIANEYVDTLLSSLHTYVEDNHLTEIDVPDIDASFSKKILWITWHGHFRTSQGKGKDLASVRRTGDISLDFDDSTGALTVFGSLGLSQLDFKYNKYEAKFMGVGPSGTLSAHIGQNSLFLKVKLILAIEPVISLQDLHIEYARDISIKVTGLGILNWLVSNIATWFVGLFNDKIVGSVDSHLQEIVSSILPTVNPNRYFG